MTISTDRYSRAFRDRNHADRTFVICLLLALGVGFAVGAAI